METETSLSPPSLHRLQPFSHSVGPPSSPFVQPSSFSEGMPSCHPLQALVVLLASPPSLFQRRRLLSPSLPSFAPSAHSWPECAHFAPSWAVLRLKPALSCPWSVIPSQAGLDPLTAPHPLHARLWKPHISTPARGTLQCLIIPGALPWTWCSITKASLKQPPLEIPCLWKCTTGLHVPPSVCVCFEWFLINTVLSRHSEILYLHYYLQN